MAKWSGKIGFTKTVETEPGLWEPTVVEKPYFGDKTSDRWRRQNSDKVNDALTLSITVSVIADSFANDNLGYMTYITDRGHKWKIEDVDNTQFPRLILTIGGIYNG